MPVYLDNNATTRPHPEVVRAVASAMRDFGNAGSPHPAGRRAAKAVEEARTRVARLVGVDPETIIFTSGATEANNIALLGKDPVHHPRFEHNSVLQIAARRSGYLMAGPPIQTRLCDIVPGSRGIWTCMLANNETGSIFETSIRELHHFREGNPDASLHSDITQAVGKIEVHLPELGVDTAAFSAHKLHGPQGIGALYRRSPDSGQSLFACDISDPLWPRPGTVPVALCVGFGVACEMADVQSVGSHTSRLRTDLEIGLLGRLQGTTINRWRGHERVPNTTNLCFPGIVGDDLVERLGSRGIMASNGSACSAWKTKPSHVLKALGLTDEEAFSSVRFSPSRYTTEADIERTIKVVTSVVRQMQREKARATPRPSPPSRVRPA